jgi:hypothetical protein
MVAAQRRGKTSTSSLEDGIAEMQALIQAAYPEATFATESGEDPDGVHLVASLVADDLDEVMDVYIDRLIDLQIDHGLRLHVIPLLSGKS